MGYFVFPPEYLPYVSTLVNFVISFTPLFSYGSTVLSIRKHQSSQGFSIDICATMLIASILRIFYYFNDPFEATLLRQCFVMVFIQTILLKVALKYRSEDAINFETYHSNWNNLFERFLELNRQIIDEIFESYNIKDNLSELEIANVLKGLGLMIFKCTYVNLLLILSSMVQVVRDIVRLFDYHYKRPLNFWQWQETMSYWKFIFGLILFLTVIQLSFMGNEYLGISFGTISFMVESSLPLPQVLLFNRLKSVENFKTILLLSWLGGDVTKISYLFFGTDNVGLIFILAAFFQMSLNLVITYQFFYYRHMEKREIEIPMTHLPGTVRHPTLTINESDRGYRQSIEVLTPSKSRAASLSLNGMITKSNNGIVVPQNQHYQVKISTAKELRNSKSLLDFVGEEHEGIASSNEDKMKIANGAPSDLQDFKHEDNQRRTTSIDFDARHISMVENFGRSENPRSRAGTINSK